MAVPRQDPTAIIPGHMTHETRHQAAEIDGASSPQGLFVEWLTVHGERAGNVLVYSSVYIAVIAMAEVAIAMVVLSLPASPAPLVVGLVTFAVYTYDRMVDADADAVANPRRAEFIHHHRDVLYVLAAVAYGLAVAISVLGGPMALAIALLPGIFWILYASNWIPDIGVPFQRLKEVLIVNSAVVALAWAVTLTVLPLAFADAAFTPTAGVIFAYFFLRSFVDTEIPNVRDVEGDRAIAVETLPVVFGVDRTRQALHGVDLVSIGLIGYAVLEGYLSLVLSVALLTGLVYSFGVTSLVGRSRNDELLAIAAECEYVVVLFSLGFVALVL